MVGKLIKYEFRKSWKMMAYVLVITAIFEAMFLLGCGRKLENMLAISISGLTLTAICGTFVIGIYSIHKLSKDLNTKQGYMLFMTPNSSFKILGAKVIESAASILLAGLFFAVLAILDIMFLTVRFEDLSEILRVLTIMWGSDGPSIDYIAFLSSMMDVTTGWIFVVTVGFFAIVLCASVLNGKKHNGLLSFIIFLAIAIFVDELGGIVTSSVPAFPTLESVLSMGFSWVMIIVMYVVTAWIMDNKLSV